MYWDPDTVSDPLDAPLLRNLLAERFAALRDERALHMGARWYTYGELGEHVGRTANALADAGARRGMRVGVMLPNGPEFVFAWLGLAILNVTMVPVNVHLVGEGLSDIIHGARLDILVTDSERLKQARHVCNPSEPAPRVLVHGIGGADSFDRCLSRAATTLPMGTPASMSDDALIGYTSGTTGPSKGVILSRLAQFWHGANYYRDFVRLGPGQCGYTPLPLFHVSAQGFVLGCFLGGAAVVIDRTFNPFTFWHTIREHRAESFNYVGAMISMLWRRPSRNDDWDNPAVRAVGSATPPELHEAFEQRFGLQLIETYGQTELAGLWLTDPPAGREIGRVGVPCRWMDAKVERDDGTTASPGETGEIALRSHHPLLMTTGYFGNEAATAHAFRGGWYHTGDAGEQDTAGSIRFVGRLKDFIRRRGENISAFEIERAAQSHAAIREAAAVAVPSSLGEDEILLAVIPEENERISERELHAHLEPRLATFMRPRYIQIREEFPRTPTQRVQKYRMRDEWLQSEHRPIEGQAQANTKQARAFR